jgi:hypothetical protein
MPKPIAALTRLLLLTLLAADLPPANDPSDTKLRGLKIFPANDPWNQDISSAKVDPLSDRIIARLRNKPLHPDFGIVYNGHPNGIPYVVVGGDQPKVPVKFDDADESDAGPYPIPADAPIEGGRDATEGDRHVIVIDADNLKLYETWNSVEQNGGQSWTAGSGAIFDLRTNKPRPAGWTSADAAGLPIFPGLVRYDEVANQRAIHHAIRFTVVKSRRAYVAPARHYAAKSNDADLPPMGARFRLKASVDLSKFPPQAKVILQALKTYGMIMADNGSDMYLSGAPNPAWDDDDLRHLRDIRASDFEVIEMGKITTR